MELHCIPVEAEGEDLFILYRPLIRLAFIGNHAMAKLAQRYGDVMPTAEELESDEALQFLQQIGFFAPDIQVKSCEPTLTNAVLLLTNRCQLRCTYCYAAAGDLPWQKLPAATGETVIDYVHDQAQANHLNEYRIDFHGGGEPTLEWDTLQALVAYARRKPIHARISVTSNAIWSEAQVKWLVEQLDFISVSMDGSPATQDSQRPFQDHKPSSPVVMRNLHTLDENGARYAIRLTACSPWTQLKGDVEFILGNTGCRALQVEPAFNTQRGERCQPTPSESRAFIGAFIEAYETAKAHGASLTYSGARPKTTASTFCAAPFNALVVTAEDQIVACYEITSQQHPFASIATFGRVQDGEIIFDQSAQKGLHRLLGERFDSCRDCFCHWTCAGDCFTRAFTGKANGHLVKSQRCEMNREITQYLLLDLIRMSGGVWKAGPAEEQDAAYG